MITKCAGSYDRPSWLKLNVLTRGLNRPARVFNKDRKYAKIIIAGAIATAVLLSSNIGDAVFAKDAIAHKVYRPALKKKPSSLKITIKPNRSNTKKISKINGSNENDEISVEHYRPVATINARDDFEKNHRYKFDKIIRGNKNKKLLALTFDDGPHAYYTVKLLNILKATHTKATFFVVGKQVTKYPTLLQLEIIEGHEIGNHTYDHVDLTQIPPELIGFELDECDNAIKKAAGTAHVHFFRPPGGNYDTNVIREAARRSYITSLWTDDPGDYSKPGADVVFQRTVDHFENGAIILLHDGIPETLAILPALIAEARKRGYEFVTMSELAREH